VLAANALRPPPATPARDRLRAKVFVSLAVLFAVFVAPSVAALWYRHDQAIQTAQRRADNLALILSEHFRRSVDAIDATLTQLALHSQRIGGATAPADLWTPVLTAAFSGLPGVGSLTVADATGTITAATIPALVGQSRADFFLFRQLASNPQSGLVADKPFKALTDGRLLIPLGRRLVSTAGKFDGVVVATLEPGRLRGFYQSVNVGPNGIIMVLHPTGLILFQEPSRSDPIGQPAGDNPLFRAQRAKPDRGILRGPLESGGDNYISSYRSLAAPPVIIAVALAESSVLTPWRGEVIIVSSITVGMGLALLFAAFVIAREIRARIAAEQQLQQSQKMEAVGQLTGGVAHDFNNILTVIMGTIELLEEGVADRPELAAVARMIDEAAGRGAELTSRLLAFARKQPLQPRPTDINALVLEADKMLRPALGETVDIVTKLDSRASPALVDPSQLANALLNLAINARDAMPDGGKLTLETGNVILDEAYAESQSEVAPGPYVMIAVSDTGTGIPAELIDHVFEPFFTTKGVGRGTGLGLSMVYGFVKQSNGHIKVYSEVGNGTTIKIYLPRAAADAGERPAPTETVKGGRERILVVEDDTLVRSQVSAQLEGLGYAIRTAPDALAALALLESGAAFDLLFTDVILPRGMNGRELADEALKRRPSLKVLYTSGYSENAVVHHGRLDPGVLLLAKPYRKEDLARMIRRALDAGAAAPQPAARARKS
jgi:signal transduction histidine kinase/CheY-like chemotaxis protein